MRLYVSTINMFFTPFIFDTFGFLKPKAFDILQRVQRLMHNNVVSPRSMNVVSPSSKTYAFDSF